MITSRREASWTEVTFELFLETCKDGRVWIKEIHGLRCKMACSQENTHFIKINSISVWMQHGVDKGEIQRADWA